MNKGFTIIELLIVFAIIAIFTAILIPQFEKHVHRKSDSSYKTHYSGDNGSHRTVKY